MFNPFQSFMRSRRERHTCMKACTIVAEHGQTLQDALVEMYRIYLEAQAQAAYEHQCEKRRKEEE